MPLYPFLDEQSGDYVEVLMDMSKVPGIGSTMRHEGRTLRRLPSMPQAPVMKDFKAYLASQKPWAPGADEYDKGGTPICHSRKSLQRFLDSQNRAVDKDGVGNTSGETLGFDGSTTV
jgi:hypothetical protein